MQTVARHVGGKRTITCERYTQQQTRRLQLADSRNIEEGKARSLSSASDPFLQVKSALASKCQCAIKNPCASSYLPESLLQSKTPSSFSSLTAVVHVWQPHSRTGIPLEHIGRMRCFLLVHLHCREFVVGMVRSSGTGSPGNPDPDKVLTRADLRE